MGDSKPPAPPKHQNVTYRQPPQTPSRPAPSTNNQMPRQAYSFDVGHSSNPLVPVVAKTARYQTLDSFYSDGDKSRSRSMPRDYGMKPSSSVVSGPPMDSPSAYARRREAEEVKRVQSFRNSSSSHAGMAQNLNSSDQPLIDNDKYVDLTHLKGRKSRYKKGAGFNRSGSIRSIRKWFQRLGKTNSVPDPHRPVVNGYVPIDPDRPSSQGYGSFLDAQAGPSGPNRWSNTNGHVATGSGTLNVTPNGGNDSGLETPSENGFNSSPQKETALTPSGYTPSGFTPLLQGIVNHGNTCYMNAVMQCLASTDLLAEYFVTDHYERDLVHKRSAQQKNARKFGSNGELTRALAQFLACLWRNKYKSSISREMKGTIGRFSREYRSGEQQDAQEFLVWLLDIVHEDLNFATSRRYKKDSIKGQSEEERAAQTLNRYRESHDSFITELLMGQFQSCVVCQFCGKQRQNYDPYMCVSLPVPQSTTKPLFVTMVYRNRQPRQLCLGLNADVTATVKEVKHCLAQEGMVQLNEMVLCELNEKGFACTYNDSIDIASIGAEKMLHAIETPACNADNELIVIAVNVIVAQAGLKRLGGPFSLKITRDCSADLLFASLLNTIRPQLKFPDLAISEASQDCFRIRIVNEYCPGLYIDSDVSMPLYTQNVDRALGYRAKNSGPIHLKVLLEWTSAAAAKYLSAKAEPVLEHTSSMELKQEINAPPAHSLNDCLDAYTKPEYLEWTCGECRRWQREAKKTLKFWSLPDVLVLHLKRFKQLPNGQSVKLDPVIQFPVQNLDLSRFTIQSTQTPNTLRRNQPQTRSLNGLWKKKSGSLHALNGNSRVQTPQELYVDTSSNASVYDLYAVCNHHGERMFSGHYTAFCRNPVDGVWRGFDDTSVWAIRDEKQLVTNASYMLFYERRASSRAFSCRTSAESGFSEHWSCRSPVPGGGSLTPVPSRPSSRPTTPAQLGSRVQQMDSNRTNGLSRPTTPLHPGGYPTASTHIEPQANPVAQTKQNGLDHQSAQNSPRTLPKPGMSTRDLGPGPIGTRDPQEAPRLGFPPPPLAKKVPSSGSAQPFNGNAQPSNGNARTSNGHHQSLQTEKQSLDAHQSRPTSNGQPAAEDRRDQSRSRAGRAVYERERGAPSTRKGEQESDARRASSASDYHRKIRTCSAIETQL